MKINLEAAAKFSGGSFVRSAHSWYLSGMKKIIPVIGLIAIFWLSDAAAGTWSGRVVSVRGPDLIRVSHPVKGVVTIMLYGVDAPENGQPFFKQAKKFVQKRLQGQEVDVLELETPQKIVTGVIVLDGININELVLKSGYGWVYKEFCDQDFCTEWLSYEEQARNNKKGLWQDDDPSPPWEWRRQLLTKVFRIFLWILPPWSD